jgi:hypothetical protein
MESHIGGHIILPKFVNNMKKEIDSELKQQMVYEQLMTYIYLKNADRSKHGTLLNGLSSQYSLGQDQYPRTIIDANNILSNHRYEQAYMDNRRKRKEKEKLTEVKPLQELQLIYPLHRWKDCATVAGRRGTNPLNVDKTQSQRANGQSTKPKNYYKSIT